MASSSYRTTGTGLGASPALGSTLSTGSNLVTPGVAGAAAQVCNVFVRDCVLASAFPMHHFGSSFHPFVTIRVRGPGTAAVSSDSTSSGEGILKTPHLSSVSVGSPLVWNHQFNNIHIATGSDGIEINIFSARTLGSDTHTASGVLLLSDLTEAASRGYALDRWVPLTTSPGLLSSLKAPVGGILPQAGQPVAYAHVIVSLQNRPPLQLESGMGAPLGTTTGGLAGQKFASGYEPAGGVTSGYGMTQQQVPGTGIAPGGGYDSGYDSGLGQQTGLGQQAGLGYQQTGQGFSGGLPQQTAAPGMYTQQPTGTLPRSGLQQTY